MTVSYQYEVASSTSGGFTRLLFMWRGSLYKLIYRELLLFLTLFGTVSALYRHILTEPQKKDFEKVVVYCDTFINLIPLSFVLGFYVAYVAERWWQQYMAIPWPDKVMHLVALYVNGNDEYGRMLRRTLMRYLNLSLILVLRSISSAVKRRFPTLDHVVDSGFMTSLELELFQSVPSIEFNTYWIPCTWFINLLKEARNNHRLSDNQGMKIIMEEFNDFRSRCGLLWSYDWVSIPLVYTQVVTLATYSFFAVALIGRQYIEGSSKQFQLHVDIYLPLFTILQFFFFMGLLKVAEQLINPFGDDDEDFELNWMIDRHTKVSYLGVDILMNRCPPLVKDIYFDAENLILPYTEAAAAYKRKTYRGSVANMTVPEEKQTMFLPNITEEEEKERNTPSPRTSSASLTAHVPDSPAVIRRQISGSRLSSISKMSQNPSETIIPMDIQEDGTEIDRSRSRVTEAVKKFSALTGRTAKTTGEQTQGRKPFFALVKPSKISIQPWPSATNLKSEPTPVIQSYLSNGKKCRAKLETIPPGRAHSFNIPAIAVRQTSIDDEANKRFGVANLAFSDQESPNESQKPCEHCDCQSTNSCDARLGWTRQQSVESDTSPKSRPRLKSYPKFSIRRFRSTSRRKDSQRKTKSSVITERRRRTFEELPVHQRSESIQQTMSSPNLSSLEADNSTSEDTKYEYVDKGSDKD